MDRDSKAVDREAHRNVRPYHCFLYSPGETPSVFRKIREK